MHRQGHRAPYLCAPYINYTPTREVLKTFHTPE